MLHAKYPKTQGPRCNYVKQLIWFLLFYEKTRIKKMNGLRLNEKIIIVTGAAGGLGQAMIEGLLMEGATILAVDQNEAKL